MTAAKKSNYKLLAAVAKSNRDNLELSTIEKLVLVQLASHADAEGNCWPSMSSLARACSCSERAVQLALRRLADLGRVSVQVSAGGRTKGQQYASNRYVVTMPKGEPDSGLDDSNGEPDSGFEPAKGERGSRKGERGAPAKGEPYSPEDNHSFKSTKEEKGGAENGARPGVHVLFDLYVEKASELYGERPATGGHHGGRIAKSCKTLLDACDGELEVATAKLCRSMQDRRKPDIHAIASKPDGFGPLAPIAGRKPQIRQAAVEVEVNSI